MAGARRETRAHLRQHRPSTTKDDAIMTTMTTTRIRRRPRRVSRSSHAGVYRSTAAAPRSRTREIIADVTAGAVFFVALLVTITAVYVGGILLFL